MNPKKSPYLSERVRYSPRALADAKDLGLLRPNGDGVDLHVLLTDNSVSVHLIRIPNNVMRSSGLLQGGIAIVDRAKQTKAGEIVYVRYNGTAMMRRLIKRDSQWYLQADDPRIPELVICDEDVVEKMGIVTASLMLLSAVENL